MTTTTGDARAKRLALREILARPTLTVMPGGFSPVYARMCEDVGFECFFASGAQMSGFLLGVRDDGIIGVRDVADHVRHIASHTSIPVLADADTGFGNATNVRYAVRELIASGVAGMQIEDQEWPKAPAPGRRSVPLDEAVEKIRVAIETRDALDETFVIAARTDHLDSDGGTFEQTLERCLAFARAGADLVWLSSPRNREQIRIVCREVPAPVLILWGGPGPTEPPPSIEEYAALGARIAQFGTVASMAGLQGAWEFLNEFHERGTAALADFTTRANAGRWGRADLRTFTAERKP
jgi:2-methylisocitrate lyase-like PEP mutase family enzyme